METLKDAYKAFTKQVLRSTLGSVAGYTAPANIRVAARKDPKEAIRALRESVKSQLGGDNRYVASPMGDSGIWVDDAYSPSGIYIKSKGKNVAKRKTTIPTINSPQSLYAWWIANSTYLPRKGKRRRNLDAFAFVSSQSVLLKTIKLIQQRVGNFISGWNAFAQAVDSKIDKFLLKGNYDRGGQAWWYGKQHSFDFVAVNENAPDSRLASYAESITEKYLPQQLNYHASKTLPYFQRSLQKQFNLKASQAGEIIRMITL